MRTYQSLKTNASSKSFKINLIIQKETGGVKLWKKKVDSEELIVLESQFKDYKLKIEARKNSLGWEVFKTKVIGDSSDLISEYFLESKKQAMEIISKLQNDRNLRTKDRTNVSLRRVYKEEYLEKWNFTVNNEDMKNFVLVKFDTTLLVDIVMHEKYLISEKEILAQISDKLGLNQFGDSTAFDIFYYKRSSTAKEKRAEAVVDVEFDYSDEEYY